jgi:hypothetical protein
VLTTIDSIRSFHTKTPPAIRFLKFVWGLPARTEDPKMNRMK